MGSTNKHHTPRQEAAIVAQEAGRGMSGEQWEIIRPLLLPPREGPGRPPEPDLRRVADAIFYDAIFYLVRTGCQ